MHAVAVPNGVCCGPAALLYPMLYFLFYGGLAHIYSSSGALLTTWGQPSSSRSISASSAPVTSSQSILLPLANFSLSTRIASSRTAIQPS